MQAMQGDCMKRFFSLTVRPFFLITGGGTALVGIYAMLPEWAMTHAAKLPYLPQYTIIIQHWGIMVGLMGAFMMGAAFRSDWRVPVFLYSALEKSFMVYLVLFNARHSYTDGFWIAAIVDASVVVYTIGYFAACGFHAAPSEQPDRR
jgi:hypothetical protein